MLHAFCAAVAHGIEERLAFALAFFDVFAGAHRGFQNLHGGDASLAVLLGEEALRNNEAKGFRKAGADGMLIRHRENADDALDGFCSIDGMQRGHDKVARFRGFESDFNRLAVAHFAYENDFWRLAQRRAQGQRKSRRIGMQFALMDGRFLMTMQKLDGIFDGEYVVRLLLVHLVENGRERGGFYGARRAGDEYDAVPQINDLFQRRGQMELFKSWNLVWNHAHDDGATAALLENIDAKPGNTCDSVRKVGGAFLLELPEGRFILTHDFVSDVTCVLRGQALETFKLQLDQLAGYFDLRRATRRKNQIADVRTGFEHGGHELRGVNRSLRNGRRRGASFPGRHLRRQFLRQCAHGIGRILGEAHETNGGPHVAC